ncbi:MAG: uncharacterized protein QOK21_644 [Solirubrobacteraceae bacterium]|jgi:uncharacterized membrane protein YfcA|nr:uncharacterized protein [Solirubrobacteraceae bacterium]
MDLTIVLFGLGVGVLVGATGMGGGSLMTPLLILLFGINPVVAVGTDLAYAAVTKTVGGWRHLRSGTVHARLAVWLAVGSCPAALAGVWVLERLRDAFGDNFDTFMLVSIAGALLLVGGLILWRALAGSAQLEREREDFRIETRHKVAAVALGAFVGFILGITSAGSGTLISIGLIIGFRLTPRRVVGTDVAHAAVLLWVAALAHLVSGNIDFGLAGTILVGSLPGVWIGSALAMRLPERGLRPALGIVLLASGLALVGKAGVDIPGAVLIGVPIALVVLSVAVLRHKPRSSPRPAVEAGS